MEKQSKYYFFFYDFKIFFHNNESPNMKYPITYVIGYQINYFPLHAP